MSRTSETESDSPTPVRSLSRVVGVFTSPTKTFQCLAKHASWIAPLLLMVILSASASALMGSKINWREYIRHRAEGNPRFSQLSDEQKDDAIAKQIRFGPGFSFAAGILRVPIAALIISVIYLAAFNLVCGAELRFATSFGITTHAFLPLALGNILTLIVLSLKAYGDVDPENIVATSLKAFLSESAPKTVLAFGSSLELFWIWCLTLLTVGFSAANPKKVKPSASFGIVFGLWGLWVVAKVVWAAL
jgi:hypothetical protein